MNQRARRARPTQTRTARILAAAVLLATFGVVTVTFVSGGGRGSAFAEANLADFVPIGEIEPNVREPRRERDASRGVFTVDCGVNENGKFSPDNPVAQPGIKNGAEHVHDFVGNLAINADSSDEALAASGTTCRNGDRSSYFWPVVRIDRSVRAAGEAEAKARALAAATPQVSCPNVAQRLPAVPQRARADVDRALAQLERQVAEANTKLARGAGRIDARSNNAVIDPLRAQRADTIRRIAAAIGRTGSASAGLVSLVDCDVSYDGAHAGHSSAQHRATTRAGAVANASVQCPTVRDRLPGVPQQARDEVNRNLDLLDRQIAEANERLVTSRGQGGPNFVDNAIMGPLEDKRAATLDRIAIAIGRNAARPTGLTDLAPCTLRNGPPAGADNDQDRDQNDRGGNEQGGNDQGGNDQDSQAGNGQAGAGQDGNGQDGNEQGAGGEPAELPAPAGPDLELPNNTGGIVRPAQVTIEYRGNPTGQVRAMPRFLRALTGDAKPISRGPANARATWTCSGFADRLSDKYPICPGNSQVMRVHDFPGCWDGQNTDSENHRAHLAFADPASGACPQQFVAIPQLRISISYDIPRDVQQRGQFALDSFPEEDHNPFSDHNDFVNVNSERQMATIVECINTGRGCR